MRITDFTELTTPTSNDLLVVVDVVNDITKKLKLSSLPVPTAVTTALATKQDSLVSGTNIKTINSTSLLGSGNITIAANPSGVSGAIQFSTGSAFGSDAANFFWDDTNNRLGVGMNVPTQALDVVGQGRFSDNILFSTDFKHIGRDLNNSSISFSSINSRILAKISTGGSFEVYNSASGTSRFAVSNGGQTTISGGGSTSATTSLLVQNSAGTTSLQITDSNLLCLGGTTSSFPAIKRNGTAIDFRLADDSGFANINASIVDVKSILYVAGQVDFGGSDGRIVLPTAARGLCVSQDYSFPVSSALLEVKSTTKGFLPPRMTTTQKNAIASPAAGLIVYDSTLGKLCVRTASAWETITSV
jgi:hypothetical protein